MPQNISSPGLWPWLSAALAIGWLLTVVLWWAVTRRARHGAPETQPTASSSVAANTARRQFLAACRADDAITARRTLLAWAAAHWPIDPPQGLEVLAQRLEDPETRAALAELNRALYKEGGQWSGARLAKYLQRLPKPDAGAGEAKPVLAPLYPASTHRSYG